MFEKAMELAGKCGTLEATLEILKTRLEVYGNEIDIEETIKYIDTQLKRVGE
jgi:hypothetical protein